MSELVWKTAVELAALIKRGEVSASEVLGAHLAQIDALNPELNAIVTYLPEMALELAREADEKQARGDVAWRIAWLADRAQGRERDQGHPHDNGLSHLPRLYPGIG